MSAARNHRSELADLCFYLAPVVGAPREEGAFGAQPANTYITREQRTEFSCGCSLYFVVRRPDWLGANSHG